MKLRLAMLLVAAFGLLNQAGAALFTTYTDRAAWEAAVGSFKVETFDSIPLPFVPNFSGIDYYSMSNSTVDAGDFSVTVDGTHGLVGFYKPADGNVYFYGDLHIPTWFTPGNKFESIAFDHPIKAFAVDLSGVGDDCAFFCSTAGGIAVSIESLDFDIPLGTTFFGISTQFAFSELLFAKPCCERDYHHMDNVSYQFVPEPNVLSLLGLSIAGLAFTGRRKQ